MSINSKDTIFILDKFVHIIENKDEYILKKGFIHVSELTIDKKTSSFDFINKLKKFLKNGKITLKSDDVNYHDFIQLFKLGMLQIESKKNVLILAPKEYKETLTQCCGNLAILDIDDFLNYDDSKIIVENKDSLLIENIRKNVGSKLKGFDRIYFINDLCNITRNRAFSRTMARLDLEYVMSLYDNENIFMFGVTNYVTGCYECLETNILTKFDMKSLKQDENEEYTIDDSSLLIIAGFIKKDSSSVDVYSSSYLTGNVFHIFTPSFECSFDANLRSPFCPNCGGINNLDLEEQNIRAINILNEITKV